ncbi:MAG TPA: serine/threonine-protein kinase [Polyangiaceae bacterium]|nr:serine/threonine-protein kinase [Polyangiaceae bacterium]
MQCPSCQTENLDGAHFCARCGALMPTGAPEPAVDPLIGQTVGGRYTIRRVLGEGGMGRVYEAFRHLAGVEQRVAVKTLHGHLSKDPQIVARFHRECGTVAQLKHPNTIKVEDFGQTPTGELYIAMEFVDGRSIARELETGGPMAPGRVERILEQVCGSLAEAHQQGVIHRDLKPENVVLMDVGGDKDFVKVLDFGIAARKDSVDAAREQKLTQQGMVLGTPPYMSPEQFTGKALDARSDVYSLAVMAYEMLTGRLPFEADTPWEWATKHMTEQPRPFEQWPSGAAVPPKMRQAIMRGLAKKPDQRPGGVREFLDELSSGGRGSLHSHELAAGGMPPTAAMSSYDTGGGPGMRTEIGAPFVPPGGGPATGPGAAGYGPPPGGGYGPPPGGPGAYAAPPPPPPPPGQHEARGPNKGLIFGLAGVAGIALLSAVGFAISHTMGSGGGGGEHLDVPTSSAHGPATIATLSPTVPLVPSGTLPTATTGIGGVRPTATPGKTATAPPANPPPTNPPTNTAPPPPPPPAVTGDAACVAAREQANRREISAAAASFRNCSGPNQTSARSAIRGQTPAAVRDAAFRNECGKARRMAADGASAGARPINVDQEYPQCKGK